MSVALNETELAELGADLVRKHKELQTTLEALTESAKIVDLDEPIGRLSRMDAMQQQKMSMAQKSNAERRVTLIETAQRLLDEGEYGFCRRCDEPIGFRRLKSRPETPLCVECQAKAERR